MYLIAKFSIALLFGSIVFVLQDDAPFTFQSLESKTMAGKTVFNRIAWFKGLNRDVWLMQQSHEGLNNKYHSWDKVAIVLDKTIKPFRASYYQLPPGELSLKEPIQKIPFKASCFACHSNGLRVIRPNWASSELKHDFYDKIKVSIWNLRIKSYGRVLPSDQDQFSFLREKIPFRHPQQEKNKKLTVKTCLLCHKDSGILARGYLYEQNLGTIKFMVENKLMPPFGIKLTGEDKKNLKKFLSKSL